MKKIFSILLMIILSITIVKAKSIDFKIIDAKVIEKYGAIEVVDPVFSSNEITSSITFKEKNDYVIYNILLENDSGKTYKLVNVEDNNTSNNVSLSYEYEKEEVLPKETVSLKVKVKYENLVKNIESVQVKDFNVILVLEDEKGNTQVIDINPKTGDNILLYVVLLLVAVAGIVLIIKKLKGGKLLVILPLLIAPLLIFGLQQFKINILFKDVEVIGTFDVFNIEIDSNNGDSTINRDIKYGDNVGSLPTPTKEGYTFVGWYDEKGNKVSEDTVITSEITLKAKYNPISYSITYYLDGGSATNVDSYTIEDEITLNNPTKSGYTFAGWTEGEDDTLRTQVTINKGTTGDKVFNAHFSTNQDTVYTVIHKQMNLNGEYEVTETEELHGATDTEVTPQVKDYEGFILPDEQTVTIAGDGSTVVTYLYERKKFTLVVNNRDYVVTEIADGSYYYGTNIILRAKERIGYTFTKWSNNETNSPLVFTLSSDLTIEPIYTPKDDTKYKVLHKIMNLDGQSYSLNEEMNETGTTDAEVTPAVKTLTGFTSPAAQTVNINADGSTVVEYLYTRNQHLLTINESDYVSTTTPSGNYYYETDITLTVLPRPGYTFVKWSNDETGNSTSFKMGDEDITISPIFTANNDTHYEVNHYLMKLDGQTYELLEGFSGTGTTDTQITPAVKTLTGFISPEAQTVTINGDGSTVVDYYYAREEYTLTITNSDYVTTETPSGNYYYETNITLTANERAGYTFAGWSNSETANPLTFELEGNMTIGPEYLPNTNTHYSVNHYLMKLDGQTYELLEGYSGTGTTDSPITPAVKTLTGFTSPEAQTVTINGDGSTVVDYFYTRNQYTLTITNSDYVTTETPSGDYYYGTSITLTAKNRASYTFDGWSNGETTNPLTFELEGNMTIGPEYLPNTNTHYSVNHYLMKLDGQTYELLEGYSGTGTTDSPITPAVKTLTGFTSPEAQTVTINGDGSTVVDYFYTRNQYTLTITNSDYVTTETPSGDYYYGTSITLTAKNRASYTFDGWSNGETTNPLTFDLESDTTIGPKYTAIEYTVTFDSQGGSEVDSITRIENEAIGTLPVPTKEGHSFLGWYTSTEYTEQINSSTPVTADVTYYAKWIDKIKELETVFFIPGSCTFNGSSNLENVGLITSSSQDGCISTVNPSGVDIDYTDSKFIDSHIALFSSDNYEKDFELGFTIDNMNINGVHSQATLVNSKLENSTENYPGFVFRKNASNTLDLTSKFGSSKEFKANFTYEPGMEIRISRQDGVIYYSLNGETWQLLKDINDYKKRFNLTTWFGAFSPESDMEATGEDSYASADRYFNGTLSNIYIKMAPDLKYTVTFDAHGGSASFESKVVKHGKPVGELPTVEKENYYFDGWFTEANGGTQVDENMTIMAPKTFHAQYAEKHTVTFNGNGATPSFSSKDVRHGSQIGTLPTVAKADYTFGGWYTDDANPTLVEETTVINKNESLIARWYADILKANISTADVVMNVGETHQIEITPITDLEEYTITSSDTNIATVNEETNVVTGVSDGIATITITGKVSGIQVTIDVLVGEIDTYAVRFVSDGETYEVRNVIPNRTVGDDMPDDPTKSGYTFVGWFIDGDIDSPFDKNTIVSGNITVEAIWTEDNNVARIGNEYFSTLQAAFNAAPDNVETEIVILRDYDVTSSDNKGRPQVNNTKNIVLIGGNYTLSCYNNNVIYNLGTTRIKSGTFECGYATKGPIENSGTFIVDGGIIRDTNDRGAIYNTKGTVIINDGIITSTAVERSVIQNIEGSAKLTVNGGLIEQLNPDSEKGAVENQKANATITINGGTIISNSTNDGVGAVQNVSGGKVTIGSKDNKHNINTPILRGKKYGVYSPSAFNFYDGILEGITAGTNLSDSQINHEENATLVDTETVTIDSDTYKKLYYVVPE